MCEISGVHIYRQPLPLRFVSLTGRTLRSHTFFREQFLSLVHLVPDIHIRPSIAVILTTTFRAPVVMRWLICGSTFWIPRSTTHDSMKIWSRISLHRVICWNKCKVGEINVRCLPSILSDKNNGVLPYWLTLVEWRFNRSFSKSHDTFD